MTRLTATLLLLSLLIGPCVAHAITASDASLPFDQAGDKVNKTIRGMIVPLVVLIAGLFVGCLFIFASRNAAGQSVRTIIGLLIIGAFLTGTGIAAFAPGLVTAVTLALPPGL